MTAAGTFSGPAPEAVRSASVAQDGPSTKKEGACYSVRMDATRTLMFPTDRSLGRLFLVDHEAAALSKGSGWLTVGDARDDLAVFVPPGWILRLALDVQPGDALGPLKRLPANSFEELDAMSLHEPYEAGLDAIAHLTGLRWLTLGFTDVPDAALVHVSRLTNLEYLDLQDSMVTDAGLVHLRTLTKLVRLELCDLALTGEGLHHLYSLQHLRTLNLHGTRVTSANVTAMQAGLPLCNVLWEPHTVSNVPRS